VLYCAVAGFGIHQHLPWADESQAWMLAQEVSLRPLLAHSLHYEGTPGLWHCFLKLIQALHLSFGAARWLSGGIAAAGVAVLLAFAPLPRIVRLLLPFSFFLAYQDAVIARSYVLFGVFAFSAAAMLRSARPRPLLLALTLGLMANISVHTLLASAGFAAVAFVLWWRSVSSRRRTAACILLLAFWVAAAWQMAPARDVDFSAGNNVWRSLARIEAQLGIHADDPPAINSLPMAGLARAPLPAHLRDGEQRAWRRIARTLAVISYPLSASRGLALLLFALVVAQGCSRTKSATLRTHGVQAGPAGLLPYLVMVAAFTSLYLEPRHAGTVFTAFVVAAWLTWPDAEALAGRRLWLERATTAVFTAVLAAQIPWTLHALASERTLPYSPDKMTADYLQQRGAGQGGLQAAGFYYYSTGPLFYFPSNLYRNQPRHRYWLWSTRMRTIATVEQVLAQRPEFIVIGGFQPGPDAEITRDWLTNTPPEPGVRLGDIYSVGEYFRQHGYHETHLFCGHSWMRTSFAEQDCESILEQDSEPDAEPASQPGLTQNPAAKPAPEHQPAQAPPVP
jgi:hypothetical protein